MLVFEKNFNTISFKHKHRAYHGILKNFVEKPLHIMHIYLLFPFYVYIRYKEVVIASQLLTIILTPLSGANPFGENINYHPDFDVLKSEMGKVGNIDYDLVEKKCLSLVGERAKDIRLLSFLSIVYLRNENWESFADVFDGLAQLIEQNYDALFPERPRAKQMAFKWLSEQRFADTLENKKPGEHACEDIKRLVGSLTKIKPILEKNFPEGSPFPSGLFSAAQKWEKAITPKPSEPAPAPSATPADQAPVQGLDTGPTPSAPPTASPAPANSGTPPLPAQKTAENSKDAMDNGRKIASFLIDKEPEKPLGYRLMRSLRWDSIEKTPLAENGKIRVEGPKEQRIPFFKNCIANADWKKLLEAAEKEFSSGPTLYWLDLQRMSATAAKNLGPAYSAVYDALCIETALFIHRLPDLLTLAYADGTPFCDEATKDWITTDAVPKLAGGSPVASGGFDDPLLDERKEVNALVSAGKTDAAVELLQNTMQKSGSERTNFKRSLLLCNLLFSSKHAEIAIAILESLHQKIATYNLDRWEPDLAVETWCLLVKAYKIIGASKPQNMQIAIQEKQNSILSKISCIDPKSALKLNT